MSLYNCPLPLQLRFRSIEDGQVPASQKSNGIVACTDAEVSDGSICNSSSDDASRDPSKKKPSFVQKLYSWNRTSIRWRCSRGVAPLFVWSPSNAETIRKSLSQSDSPPPFHHPAWAKEPRARCTPGF